MNHQFFPWWFVRLFRILPLKQRPGTRYSEVAPAVRDFRAAVLDVAKGTKATGMEKLLGRLDKKHLVKLQRPPTTSPLMVV